MLVDAKNNKHEDSIIAGKVVKGVLWVTHKSVFTQDYHAENKSDHDKTLIVEHPFRPDWKLVQPAKPIEKTDTLYRFKESVPAGKTADLRVVEEHVNAQQIAILPADVGALDVYRKTGSIPKSVRDVLEKAIAMKNALTDTQRQIEDRRRQINDINNEQQRIRENLKTIDRNSDYATRLIKKLDDQETTIEKLQGEIEDLTKKQNTQRQDLETYLQNTTTEDK
jgi:hypothetical protein